MSYLFVYGSLKRDCSNHYIIERLNYVGEYYTKEEYYKEGNCVYKTASDNYTKPPQKVLGELYELRKHFIPSVDRFELHPKLFHRELIYVIDKVNQEQKLSYIYFKTGHCETTDVDNAVSTSDTGSG